MQYASSYAIASGQQVSFRVHEESDWLAFRFDCEEKMTWGMIRFVDPKGQERFLYYNVHSPREGILHVDPAYTSYLGVPGRILAGDWKLEFTYPPRELKLEWSYGMGKPTVDIPLPSPDRDWWTDGAAVDERYFALNLYDWQQCRNPASGWYGGDFHTHTILSDGKMTPEQATELAEQLGLDFFVATDHNALPSSWPKSKVLVIPGVEITSHGRGDWNAIGTTQSIDCWSNLQSNPPYVSEADYVERTNALFKQVGRTGAIRSVNHPLIVRFWWNAPGTLLSEVDALELWNSPTMARNLKTNERALILWSELWNAGYQITGLGGSDTHYFPHEPFEAGDDPQVIGDPRTFVKADRLSPHALLDGVRRRNVYVTRGKIRLEGSFAAGGQTFTFGDDLTEAIRRADGQVECCLKVTGLQGGHVQLVVDGKVAQTVEISEDQQELREMLDWGGVDYTWMRYDCRSADGRLWATSNPVFVGQRERSIHTWQELMERAERIDPNLREAFSN